MGLLDERTAYPKYPLVAKPSTRGGKNSQENLANRRIGAYVSGSMPRGMLFGILAPAFAAAVAAAEPPQSPENRSPAPALSQDAEARRNIRGCDSGEACSRTAELLREFELQAFPKSGQNPWIEGNPARSTTSNGDGGSAQGASRRRVANPSELRPDQPWLDKLVLPDLPVVWTQKLVDYLMFYKDDPRGREIMSSWLVAQGRYRDLIVWHLRKAHLPEDLLYDAMIESSYDPYETSYAGALGLWQFMPQGGKIYGLRQDRWVDERRDPLRSTIAVLDYWADLHQRFSDWNITLAAFNAGYGAVLRSIARYNTNDYYQLCEYENGLPWETCLYTPKVLAAAIVGRNRAAFGYDQLKELPAETWDEVALPASMSIATIAKVAGATEGEIKRLNPQLKRNRTPPGEVGYVVRVPRSERMTKQALQQRFSARLSDDDGADAYVIGHGERLEDVATVYGISVSQLKKLNGIQREAEVEGGTALVVPRVSEQQKAENRAKAKAKLLGSGVDHKDGEALIVPVLDKDAVVPGKRRVFYRVVAGDSVASVASALSISARDLLAWNGLEDSGRLHPKMVLVAFVDRGFDAGEHRVSLLDEADLEIVTRGSAEHLDVAEARAGRVRTEYVASGTEKLADVAKKFGMGSHDLARINRIPHTTTLDKGQAIIVYEVNDRSRSKRADEQWHKTPRARRGKVSALRAQRAASSSSPSQQPVTQPAELDR